jgi:hypothetical protein
MVRWASVIIAAAIVLSGAPLGRHGSSAQAQVAEAVTVGSVIVQARSLVKEIDDRASALMRQGNSVAAQQQMLLSGLITGAIEQIEKAYATQMNATVDRLMGAEKEAFTRLAMAFDDAERLAGGAAQDVSKAIRQTHAATTEVLSRVPFADKYPVIHGLVTRDMLNEFDGQPDDLQILGFFLVDPELKELPEIWVNGTRLTNGVTAYFDRIQVQLPASIKEAFKLANTPCEPRQTFSVWMRVAYNKPRGIWPATWKERSAMERNMVASPGEVQYEVSLLKSGVTTTTGTAHEAFRVESPNFNWSCEENAGNHADFTVPAGHTLVEKHVGWAELGGRWENHGCSVSDTGGRVVGSCSVKGGNKSWGQCSGGGHGRVALWGTTRKEVTSQAPFENELVRQSVMRGAERHDTIELGPGQTISGVRVEIRRINAAGRCEQLADDVVVSLNPVTKLTHRSTSRKGMFEVATDGSQVSLRRK